MTERQIFSKGKAYKASTPNIIVMTILWIVAIVCIYFAKQNADSTYAGAIVASIVALLFSILVLSAVASPPQKIQDPHEHFNEKKFFSVQSVSSWTNFSNQKLDYVYFEPGTRFLIASRHYLTRSRWLTGGSAVTLQGDNREITLKGKEFYSPNQIKCVKTISDNGSVVYSLKHGQVIVPLTKPSGFPGFIPSKA